MQGGRCRFMIFLAVAFAIIPFVPSCATAFDPASSSSSSRHNHHGIVQPTTSAEEEAPTNRIQQDSPLINNNNFRTRDCIDSNSCNEENMYQEEEDEEDDDSRIEFAFLRLDTPLSEVERLGRATYSFSKTTIRQQEGATQNNVVVNSSSSSLSELEHLEQHLAVPCRRSPQSILQLNSNKNKKPAFFRTGTTT